MNHRGWEHNSKRCAAPTQTDTCVKKARCPPNNTGVPMLSTPECADSCIHGGIGLSCTLAWWRSCGTGHHSTLGHPGLRRPACSYTRAPQTPGPSRLLFIYSPAGRVFKRRGKQSQEQAQRQRKYSSRAAFYFHPEKEFAARPLLVLRKLQADKGERCTFTATS